MMKHRHEQIQYIEFLSENLPRIRRFYEACFGWSFTDYGPEYTAFEGDFVDGGFALGKPMRGSVLVVLYSENLEETQRKIEMPAVKLFLIFSVFRAAKGSNSQIPTAMN